MPFLPPNVTYIPPTVPMTIPVGIYCRVSTNSAEQLKSLVAQVSGLTRLANTYSKFRIVEIYIDICSSKTGMVRPEFNRMIEDCKNGKINVVLTKNISRFGRDTIEVLNAVNLMRELNIRLIIQQEAIDTEYNSYNIVISCYSAFAQADNESRSANIRWGLQQKAADGSSKLYNRKCYGFGHDENGRLNVIEEEAKIVRKIFNWYLEGMSIVGIVKELEKLKIKSPTGKDRWCKRSIDTMLSNTKYVGDAKISITGLEVAYLGEDNNPAIISRFKFDAVQLEKVKRCNVEIVNGVTLRKKIKYSSK